MIHLYCWLNNMHTYRILSIYTGSICSLKGLCRDTLVHILLTGVPSICCSRLASTTHPSSFGKLSCPCGSDGGADYSSHLPGHWKRHITSPEFFELKVEVIALPCPLCHTYAVGIDLRNSVPKEPETMRCWTAQRPIVMLFEFLDPDQPGAGATCVPTRGSASTVSFFFVYTNFSWFLSLPVGRIVINITDICRQK